MTVDTANLEALMAQIPKAELHLHIEGTLEPELMFEISKRNGIPLSFKSVEEIRAAYNFSCLQDFLDIYYAGAGVLREEQDFYDLTYAYLERAHADGVVHAEIFFDPQTHTARNVPYARVLQGLRRACQTAERQWGLTTLLIPNILRHLSEEEALKTLDEILEHREHVHGLGLDSGEKGNPPSKFKKVYARALGAGLRLTAHAGEEGGPDYVCDALHNLGVERIDHGVRSMEDEDLLKQLAAARTPLTVCPLSNLKLCVVKDMSEHPIKKLLDKGVCAMVNSDDPAYFGGYVLDNYRAIQKGLNLNAADIYTLARNSIEASWVTPKYREHLEKRIDEVTKSLGFGSVIASKSA